MAGKDDIVLEINVFGKREAFPSGVVGQISIHRLMGILRSTGEIKPTESITHVRIFNDGTMQYRVETREKSR